MLGVTQPSGTAVKAFGWELVGMVALGALVGGRISGASMNPSRSLGPALVSANLTDLWIYLSAP